MICVSYFEVRVPACMNHEWVVGGFGVKAVAIEKISFSVDPGMSFSNEPLAGDK